jgi:ribosomal protein S18 acetylase RimI-like enzyme
MDNYIIRKATLNDLSFLAETIIAAEKSNTEKLSLSTLFNLSEATVKEKIIAILEEEIDGCEFSVSSFLIVEYNGNPVAALGGWIECLAEEIPSKILKSNLIGFIFPKESIKFLQTHSNIIENMQIERESYCLQLEYLYVDSAHRGKRLAELLIKEHIQNALSVYPKFGKVQLQVFNNNHSAIKLYERIGFRIVKSYKSNNNRILDFLPSNEKLLMEK